jgi:ATP-dependent RNA helicase DeaD
MYSSVGATNLRRRYILIATSSVTPNRDSNNNFNRPRFSGVPHRSETARPPASASEPLPRDQKFGDLDISAPIAIALKEMGYEQPTPIQTRVIPTLLGGKDVVGQAQTGTGKTAAFGIPLTESINTLQSEVQGMVLTPTRELAVQVTAELARIGRNRGIRVVAIYGGQNIERQIRDLRRGAHIVVGTPGRMLDHLGRRTLNLSTTKIAVLDEADEMLDIGFADAIEEILRQVPDSRQTALFSATMPTPIRRMVSKHLRSPEWIRVGEESQTVSGVEQVYYEVAMRDRNAGLKELLSKAQEGQTIIFCRTQRAVERVAEFLGRSGYRVAGIHGRMSQSQRDRSMQGFRSGNTSLLVATNLAARGLDIPAVSRVINYDQPQNVEEYVHRIGRTGRMGRGGEAITFVGEWDYDAFEQIKRHVGDALKRKNLAIYSRY